MKILLVGGGTGGSVSPLLAVAQKLRELEPNIEFAWVGTKRGPEKNMVTSSDIAFKWIFSGKLRRYFSWHNFIDPFLILAGLGQSFLYLRKERPQVVVSAGSFVAVPVSVAAWFLRIPILIHQQDIRPGLANKILSRLATYVTVAFAESVKNFSTKKTTVTGNPIRMEILQGNRDRAIELFNLNSDLPTVLLVGGGTGSLKINQLAIGALPELLGFYQVIHITGRGKKLSPLALKEKEEFYHPFEFLVQEMPDALAIADVVVTRAGLGFLTELSALSKPTVIIPIPDSHQEDNANFFTKNGAAVTLNQKIISGQSLAADLKELLSDSQSLQYLSAKIHNLYEPKAAENIAKQILYLKSE